MEPAPSESLTELERQGIAWLRGDLVIEEFNGIKLNPKQVEFLNHKSRFNLVSGGMSSGKTLGFILKVILLSQWFPGCKMLIGRKTKENAEQTFMKDFMEVCPQGLYEHSKGYHKITFTNGSEAEFWGLDALQSGATTDIKKAEQQLKSHNFSFVFIDQLEEIEEKVFQALNSRMRRRQCKHHASQQRIFENAKGEPIFEICQECGKASFNQMNMTTNPANFWGYQFFKANPAPMTHLSETSMLDNREYLSEAFIQSELLKPRRYVQKYVHGEWSPDSLVESAVFDEEHIKAQEFHVKLPIRSLDGIDIFHEPTMHEYQVGIDPSLGASDPCCIKVVDTDTMEEVASFSGFVPTNVISEKAVRLANMYSLKKKPLIIPESTGVGQALVEDIKRKYDRIYEREVFSQRENKRTNKLGFQTTYATKEQLIEHMKELFQSGSVKVRDRKTVEEMKTFIYSDEVRKRGAGAQDGYHDDRIMALMLAFWNIKTITVRETNLLKRLQAIKKTRKPINYPFI